MKMISTAMAAAAVAALLGGCVGYDERLPAPDEGAGDQSAPVYDDQAGLVITAHDASRFVGTFALDGVAGSFAAEQTADTATAELRVGDKTFRLSADTVDGRAGVGWVGGHALSSAELAGMRALVDRFVAYLGPDTPSMGLHEGAVATLAFKLSREDADTRVRGGYHPVYYDGSKVARETHNGFGDDGSTCVSRGTTRRAYWTNSSNQGYYADLSVGGNYGANVCNSGDYSCMGRCGAGCSGFGGAWTLDCLEHDGCSHWECASGGASDADCGDEYRNARDDFLSFWCGG